MKRIVTLIVLLSVFVSAEAQIQQLQKLSQLSFGTSCAGVWHYSDSTGSEYALLGNGDGLVIVDVTDPVNPSVLFTVPAASSLWREVKTYGHFAYAGTEGGGGITIVDLSGLPATYQSQVYTGDGPIAGQLTSSHTVQVFDGYLYIFGSNIGTVICSLADPWNPTYVGTYSANYVHDGYVLNDTLYSSEIYAGQFSVVDVTDKSSPTVLATQPTPGLFNHNGWFSDNHQYFFTTDEQHNTPVGVFNVTDIQNIELVSTYVNDTMADDEVHNVRVFNDYLICPSYGSQLTIVDAARPENLIEIARYHTGGYLCWDASPYLPSGNIIATDMDGEFYVFAPYFIRACYLEGNITDQFNGNPVNGASVKILSTTKVSSSDIIGDYKTGYPTAGTYDVEFSAPGYLTKVITGVSLTNGNLTTLNVQLEPFALNIQVIDFNTSQPVPMAKVKIQNSTTDLEFTTDSQGELSVTSLVSGSYDITAALWGYQSECTSFGTSVTSVVVMALKPGIYDDFTFDFGWTTSSTASSGDWVREEPVGTMFSTTQANPEFDMAGDCSDRCYITGNGGGTANGDDVDDGTVTLVSPAMDLTGYSDPYLCYTRWFYEQFAGNPSANDTMFVSISNGASTAIVDVITGPSATISTWLPVSIRVLDFIAASTSMNVTVWVSDKLGTGNPLECGFDRFFINEGPTAVTEIKEQSNISVYPNPFTDKIEIESGESATNINSVLQVTDIAGRILSETKIEGRSKITLSTEKWGRGVYFVKIINENKIVSGTRKITRM